MSKIMGKYFPSFPEDKFILWKFEAGSSNLNIFVSSKLMVINNSSLILTSGIEMCIGFKQRVCEEAFEVPGTSTCPDSLAPQRARKNFQKQVIKYM